MVDRNSELFGELNSLQYILEQPTRVFKPWHKPRKQYVRRLHLDNELIPLLTEDDGPIRYLGLPGSDMLDLHWMQTGVCERYQRTLLFVGFDLLPNDESSRSLIETAKLSMSGIDGRSEVIPTAFQSIADRNSHAYQRAERLGAFDVINIDLCNGLASEEPSAATDTMYNALANLMGIQDMRTTPWLLMLTTRIDGSNVSAQVGSTLEQVLEHNCATCEDFASEFENCYGAGAPGSVDYTSGNTAVLASIRSVAIAKWIIALAASKDLPAQLTSAITYTVNDRNGHPDLLSLAFRVDPREPVPARDRYSLALKPGHVDELGECIAALCALDLVSQAPDADLVLSNDVDLQERARLESAQLLERAGYSLTEYDQWLGGTAATSPA